VALVLILVSLALLALSAIGHFARRKDWRAKIAEAEAKEI